MRAAKILSAVSLGLAVCASVFFLLIASYSNGEPAREVTGPRVVLRVLVFPVIIPLLPVLIPRQTMRVAAAILLSSFSVGAILSIGVYYLPAAVVMLVAACLPEKKSGIVSGQT
jgi:ABC-type transport system involved in cytochrome c biogenesis permease component